MPATPVIDETPDRRRIRLGLGFLGVVVAVSLVMFFVIQAPVGKIVMLSIALFTVARTYTIVRSIRRS